MPAVGTLDMNTISLESLISSTVTRPVIYKGKRVGTVVNTYEHLSKNEGASMENGMDRESLIVSNMDIVDTVVYKLKVRKELMDDARSEGYLALVKAADKYNKTMGVQFSTFAYSCISGAIKNMMTYKRGITYPAEVARKASMVRTYLSNNNMDSVFSLKDSDWAVLGVTDAEMKSDLYQYMSEVLSTDVTVTNSDGDESSFEIIDERAYVDNEMLGRENVDSIIDYISRTYDSNNKGGTRVEILKYIVWSIANNRNETFEEIGNKFGVKKQTVYRYLTELKGDETLKEVIKNLMY